MAQIIVDKARLTERFNRKRILVLGLGVLGGGTGVARFFAELGAQVVATDLKTADKLNRRQLRELEGLGVQLILGGHRKQDILESDLIVRNPAIPDDSIFLKLARQRRIPVTMDEALFARLCPKPIIGITGTRGKTTTTFMTAAVFRQAGFDVLVGGNVKGGATLPLLWQIKNNTKIVLELSSWALQGFSRSKISPRVAIVTNIYPDHLNRYESMKEYVKDKEAIFRYQKKHNLLILNRRCRYTKRFARIAPSGIKYFSANDLPLNFELKVPGDHNRENAAAVFIMARSLGISERTIKKALEQFGGVPYRLQKTRVKRGVEFVNDTTSTTPAACIAALKTFSGKDIVLIIGGATKNLPLGALVEEIAKSKIKGFVFLAGAGTRQLQKKLKAKNLLKDNFVTYTDIKPAVKAARDKASKGDIVLFSPAFTSFAMFENEFDRGEQFDEAVEKLQ